MLVTVTVTGGAVVPGRPHLQVGRLDRRVAEPVAEGVPDRDVGGHDMPVADHHAFAVPDVPLLAREVQVARGVLQPQRDRLGQPTGGVDRAGEQVRECAPAGLAEQEPGQHGVHVVVPALQGDDPARGEDDDRPPADRGDRPDQLHLRRGQVERGPVEALGLVAVGQPGEDDRDVGVPRDVDRLRAQGRGRRPCRRG